MCLIQNLTLSATCIKHKEALLNVSLEILSDSHNFVTTKVKSCRVQIQSLWNMND